MKFYIIVYWWDNNAERDVFVFWQSECPSRRQILERINAEYDYDKDDEGEGFDYYGPFDVPAEAVPAAATLSEGVDNLINSFLEKKPC